MALPTPPYGSEYWALTKGQASRIQAAEMIFLRHLAGYTPVSYTHLSSLFSVVILLLTLLRYVSIPEKEMMCLNEEYHQQQHRFMNNRIPPVPASRLPLSCALAGCLQIFFQSARTHTVSYTHLDVYKRQQV